MVFHLPIKSIVSPSGERAGKLEGKISSIYGAPLLSLTLYFLRHGQTSCSRDNVFCGSGLDPELTAEGQAMAESFADSYRSTP